MAIVDDVGGTPISKKITHDDVLFGANGTPSTQAFGDSATIGTALDATRSDHKHAMPAQPAQIATGSYAGNGGTSQVITGVGFTVRAVFIWKRVTTDAQSASAGDATITTDTIVDDNAAGMAWDYAAANVSKINMIIALGSDGFTVDDSGGDLGPNASSTTYNFLAFG